MAKKLIDYLAEGTLDEQALSFALQALQTLVDRTSSSDVHRSLALFITYSLHRDSSPKDQTHDKQDTTGVIDNHTTASTVGRSESKHSNGVQGVELAIAVLEMYARTICPDSPDRAHINKFAKSVSNKVCEVCRFLVFC